MAHKVKYIDKNIVDVGKKSTASSKAVRDFRAKLSIVGPDASAYEFELLKAYAQNQVNAAYVMPALVLAVGAFAIPWIGFYLALLWGAIAMATHVGLSALARRFINSNPDIKLATKWRRYFLASQFTIATSWTVFALASCIACAPGQMAVLQFSALLAFNAATSMMSYSFGRMALAMIAPPTLALATRFVITKDPSMLLMAGVLVISILFFFFITNRFRASLIGMLKHTTEKEALIVELETEKGFSEEARKRAEDANVAKSRFLATMSHELRTPLNAIIGFSEMMKDEILGPIENENYREYSKDIHSSGSHLLKLINDILDISRIEAGKHELKEDTVSLVSVADQARHIMAVKAKQKNVTLLTHYEKDLETIWIDQRAIYQVTLNLLSNALKFTPSGGTITLTIGWTSTGGQYISVKDTGPGIPEDEIPIVLSSFGQGSIAIKDAEQGTGLGLTIVQSLLFMHQGRFDLKSKLRQGTEAVAYLPKERVSVRNRPEGAQPGSSTGKGDTADQALVA